MVRGRRVRAVVACTRNDDCCSPNPKRKDQKIILNGKLTHAVVTPNNNPSSITEFFQAVCDIDIKNVDMNDVTEEIREFSRNTRRKGTPTKLILTDTEATEVFNTLNGICNDTIYNNCHNTPVVDKFKMTYTDINSPPTPHRIELRSETTEENAKQEKDMPKPLTLPNKVQRKLNINQEINQHVEKKVVEKDNNHKLTDYFPVRRSVRKTKKTVLEEKQKSLELEVRSGIEDGLEVKNFEGKGRGVVAAKNFEKGDFVIEYIGDLIDPVEAKMREEKYAQDQNMGCYMYYFKHCEQQYCIDATAETGKLGRLVNHSRYGNLATRTIMVDNKPRLVLIAKENINVGQEVLYDYGDRSKESLKHHPWLAY